VALRGLGKLEGKRGCAWIPLERFAGRKSNRLRSENGSAKWLPQARKWVVCKGFTMAGARRMELRELYE